MIENQRGNTMKLQLTTLAAAVALAVSFSASAANPVTETTKLNDNVNWGVNNISNSNAYKQDDNAWTTTNSTGNDFPTARTSFNLGKLPNSSASGQNIEATTQTGNGNSASTVQTNTDNESSIDQIGNLHFADTDQSGEGNYSRVNQDLGEGGVVNTLQTGNNNRSAVDQLGSTFNGADIFQGGNDNASYVLQGTSPGGADNNAAWVVQNGSGNKSYIGQTHEDNNQATATQNGETGTSYIIQMGSKNEALLTQDIGAISNESFILQDNRGFASAGHYANVTQGGGSANIATVTQLGQAQATAESTVNQSGSSNQASVIQY
jgi:hypothetical protein